MSKKQKEFVVSKERMLTVYPILHETKEKGMFKRILKKLLHIKKGYWRKLGKEFLI